jgi:hypothetical protein
MNGLVRLAGLTPLVLAVICSPAQAVETELSGAVRLLGEVASANRTGRLAPANTLMQAGQDSLRSELSLKGRAGPVRAEATLWQAQNHPGGGAHDSRFNELYWAGQAGDWHLTLGKKIVSWDVGQGFRPLDVIQQENRRALYGGTLEGVRVAMAERYVGDAAWSAVLANPLKDGEARGPQEAAAALRYYLHHGRTDWHAVARWGRRTGSRGGVALAWVASDAIEVHASLLRADRLDRVSADGLPDAAQPGSGGWQSTLGASWTGENQLSLLTEYWHDSRAWRSADWQAWQARASGLPAWLPAEARQGALAALATAFGTPNLRRDNLLVRAAWTVNGWDPAIEMVYMPADRGRITTASLAWQGDVLRLEGGYRRFDGPRAAVSRQLPDRHRAYLWLKYAF